MKTIALVLTGFGSLTCGSIAIDAGGSGTGSAKQTLPTEAARKQQPTASTRSRLDDAYGKLPLMFEANAGQTDPQVRFISRGQGYSLFVTATGAVMTLSGPADRQSGHDEGETKVASRDGSPPSTVLRMEVAGANPQARVTGQDELPGKINYFTGADPTQWRTNIPTFARVKCEQVYPGVDLVYYGNQQELEYDFIVAPGGEPDSIRLNFEGASALRVDDVGDLVITTAGGDVRQRKPFIYQEVERTKREIPGSYTLTGPHQVAFQIAGYDRSAPLVIDPVLSYSTYFRGHYQFATCIAVDSSGNAYLTGTTTGGIQTTGTPLFGFGGGGRDAFVAKLNASGSALVYSTYLGGNAADEGFGIAVDSSGDAYVTGQTLSPNFPILNGFQTTRNGIGDFFVTRLNATGSALVYSTYFGGSAQDTTQRELGTEVDASGNLYLAGTTYSADFPTTANGYQSRSAYHGFLSKLNTNASGAASLAYSTQLDANVRDVAVDGSGNACVVGTSNSFPSTEKAVRKAAIANGGPTF